MDATDTAHTLASTLLDASPDGLFLVGPDGLIRLANRQGSRMFGYESDELVGTSVDALVPDEHRGRHAALRRRYAEHPRQRPMGTDLQLRGRHRDGELFPVEISLSPVRLGPDECAIATVRDVTERQETMARVALLRERERIGRDIHDMVIQRIFAAGMSLQAVVALIDSPAARERIATVTDDLDETIRQLRHAIFELGQGDDHHSLSAHLATIVDERSRHLSFVPKLTIRGRIDDLPEFLGEQLVATITEALSNVARHAQATTASIEVTRSDGVVSLTVRDDGVGIRERVKPRGGLSNMMWRAAELGGTCTVAPRDPVGTVLDWTVPLTGVGRAS